MPSGFVYPQTIRDCSINKCSTAPSSTFSFNNEFVLTAVVIAIIIIILFTCLIIGKIRNN